MSNGNDNNTVDFNGDDDLRDPVLRRALDHAPDRDAAPDPRTRDAIRKMAHNLAAAPAPTPASAANHANAAPWWRRLFGSGGTQARMPWNAAFATVLVATFVAVLWHREPIPDARLDGEARVGGTAAPAPAAAPTPPSAEPAPQAPNPAIAAQQAPAAPVAEAPAAPARDSAREARDRSTADAVRRPVPAPAPARKQAAPAPEINRPAPEPPPLPPPAPAAAQAPAPLPAPATAAPGIAEQAARARQKSEGAQDERALERRSSAYATAPAPSAAPPSIAEPDRTPPVIAAAPAAPVAPGAAPPRRESADSASASIARGGSANAEVSGALRDAPPPRAAAAAKAARAPAGTPSFSALDRWTSFEVTRDGVGVRHARGDIEGLAALVNAVARSATTADAQLAAPVEARLSFYQGSTSIAVLEIAGEQVRWTPQPGGAAAVGTPPAQALAALRALLTR